MRSRVGSTVPADELGASGATAITPGTVPAAPDDESGPLDADGVAADAGVGGSAGGTNADERPASAGPAAYANSP